MTKDFDFEMATKVAYGLGPELELQRQRREESCPHKRWAGTSRTNRQ